MFKGYCFREDGSYTPAVTLKTVEEVKAYVRLQMKLQYEVRIVDAQDFTVLQAINGTIVFPEPTR